MAKASWELHNRASPMKRLPPHFFLVHLLPLGVSSKPPVRFTLAGLPRWTVACMRAFSSIISPPLLNLLL